MKGGAAARPPRVVGRYALYEPLGKGGAASVFLSIERGDAPAVVAVKLLHEAQARDSAAVSRLLDEVRLSRLVKHPNVVRVRDFVSDGTEMLTVMDYVHGEPLSRLLVAKGARSKVSPPIALSIMVDVLQGVQAAHEATDTDGTPLKIVHRDVTPENVLVGDEGVARITDFGVAKAEGRLHKTRDGGVRGKLMYLAPEQVGGEVTAKTDIYAAGLVLWEMLVGARPIEGETEAELVTRALAPKIARPSTRVPGLSPAIDDIVMRALAPDPESRFESAREMAEALVATGDIAPSEVVAGWVQSLAGPALAARSDAITAMLDAERGAEVVTAVGPVRSRSTSIVVPAEKPVTTLASPGIRTPTELMVVPAATRPVAAVPSVSVSVASASLPPASLASASLPSAPLTPPPSDSKRLLTGIVIGIVAAFVGAGVVLLVRPTEPQPAPVMTARDASTPLSADEAGAPADDASAPTTSASSVETAAPPPSETASARPKPLHNGKVSPTPPPTKCDPPWLIDSKGIRRYNPACIR